jgi:hypothetical protein
VTFVCSVYRVQCMVYIISTDSNEYSARAAESDSPGTPRSIKLRGSGAERSRNSQMPKGKAARRAVGGDFLMLSAACGVISRSEPRPCARLRAARRAELRRAPPRPANLQERAGYVSRCRANREIDSRATHRERALRRCALTLARTDIVSRVHGTCSSWYGIKNHETTRDMSREGN